MKMVKMNQQQVQTIIKANSTANISQFYTALFDKENTNKSQHQHNDEYFSKKYGTNDVNRWYPSLLAPSSKS